MALDPADLQRPALPEQELPRAPLGGTSAQAIQRLQVGLFGLAAMVLLVALANIIRNNADQNRRRRSRPKSMRYHRTLDRALAAALLILASGCGDAAPATLPENRPELGLMGKIPLNWGEEAAFGGTLSGDVTPHWARAQP